MWQFKYLGATLPNQNYIHKIKGRLNSGNTPHHSFKKLTSSQQLPTNVKTETYNTIT